MDSGTGLAQFLVMRVSFLCCLLGLTVLATVPESWLVILFFLFQHPFTSKGASLQSLVLARNQAGFCVPLSSSPLQYFSSYYPHRSLALVLPPVGSP